MLCNPWLSWECRKISIYGGFEHRSGKQCIQHLPSCRKRAGLYGGITHNRADYQPIIGFNRNFFAAVYPRNSGRKWNRPSPIAFNTRYPPQVSGYHPAPQTGHSALHHTTGRHNSQNRLENTGDRIHKTGQTASLSSPALPSPPFLQIEKRADILIDSPT
mgnify:CR=1 FL=1